MFWETLFLRVRIPEKVCDFLFDAIPAFSNDRFCETGPALSSRLFAFFVQVMETANIDESVEKASERLLEWTAQKDAALKDVEWMMHNERTVFRLLSEQQCLQIAQRLEIECSPNDRSPRFARFLYRLRSSLIVNRDLAKRRSFYLPRTESNEKKHWRV